MSGAVVVNNHPGGPGPVVPGPGPVNSAAVAVLIVVVHVLLFFFSSRRRHTRLTCDWSSDVCSSDLLNAGGIVVAQVFPNTPAALAGLQPGDILTKIDGKPVRDPKMLQSIVARLSIGKPIAVEFVRAGKTRTAAAPVEEQPASYASGGVPVPHGLPAGLPSIAIAKLGLRVA